ncbi:hypothetical protein [Brachybacterium sp. GPGPB12]|uniref:hypothetical protein n=1 Tax=Brachybacterium sp. GPGPB12 TaxID=3023517 RepID=UPI0031345FAA
MKWSGLYFVAVFGIMTVLWDWWARRTIAQPRWFLVGLVKDAIPAFFAVVGTAPLTYLVSWAGWFASSVGYNRHLAVDEGVATGFGPLDALISLWLYHRQAYDFHVGLDSEHPYQAHPAGWLLRCDRRTSTTAPTTTGRTAARSPSAARTSSTSAIR